MPLKWGIFNSCCKIFQYKWQDINVIVGHGGRSQEGNMERNPLN